MRNALVVDSIFAYGDDLFTVTSTTSNTVFATDSDGVARVFSASDLLTDSLFSLPGVVHAAKARKHADIDAMSDKSLLRLKYVNLIETGSIDGTPTVGGEWGPNGSKSRAEQIAMAAEVCDKTGRTVREWLKKHRDEGAVGVADARWTNTTKRFGRTAPEVVALVEKVVVEQTNQSRVSDRQIVRLVQERAKDTNLTLPGTTTLRNLVATCKQGRGFNSSAANQRSKAMVPAHVAESYEPTRPMQVVEIDTTTLDLLSVTDDRDKPFRCFLTVAIDVYSRCVVAWRLTSQSPSADDAGFLLYDMLRPKKLRDGWPENSAWDYAIPETIAFPNEKMAVSNVPAGIPESISLDNGSIFTAEQFKTVCRELGITLFYSRPGRPTDKPHIERFFRTVSEQFTSQHEGFVGNSVHNRGSFKAVDAAAHLTPAEVEDEFADWVNGYHQTPHLGLPVDGQPNLFLTPHDKYGMGMETAGVLHVPPPTDLWIRLLKKTNRAINQQGIQIDHVRYDCEELTPYKQIKSPFSESKGKWMVRYDVRNMDHIWVYIPQPGNPSVGEWLKVPAMLPAAVRPFAQTEIKYANKLAAAGKLATEHDKEIALSKEMVAYRERARERKFLNAEEKKIAIRAERFLQEAALDADKHHAASMAGTPKPVVPPQEQISLLDDEYAINN